MATYYPTSTNHQRNHVFPYSYLSTQQEYSPCPLNTMFQNHNSTDGLDRFSGTHEKLSRDENHQELSLCLGMQVTSSSMDINLPSFQYSYLSTTPHVQDSSVDFLSVNRPVNMVPCSISVVPRVYNSRYLKPTQELLEEVVNIHEALRHLKTKKDINLHKFDSKFELTPCSFGEVSASEKKGLQNKTAKLFSLLDEVDTKYREYCHHLRLIEGSLDMVTGCGAARSYTTLAHRTISRHFRGLRDAVNAQIQITRKAFEEPHDTSETRVLPRLRNVEKQLRRSTLSPLGAMRQSWRPQRGLPEGSVSILRAWLFEHFLNPYPKDSEKIMLARQTGLTRSQIANWFINARVRLWKPMVEDMYKEEFRDKDEIDKSSPEKTTIDQSSSSSENKAKEFQGDRSSMGAHNRDFVNDQEVNMFVGQRHFDLEDEYRFDDPQLLPDFVV